MKFLSPGEQLLYSTVKVETKYSDGSEGSATAFGYHHIVDGGYHNFLVTNKHVVQNAAEGTLLFTRSSWVDGEEQPLVGEPVNLGIRNFEAPWVGHPDPEVDVAVLSVANAYADLENSGRRVYLRSIASDMAVLGAAWEDLDAIEQVVFIGYPTGMYDTKNLTPIVRTGVTATHPALDYCGRKTFLIDASVFPGSSGSPVFIFNSGLYSVKGVEGLEAINIGPRVLFLGILSSVFTHTSRGRIEMMEIPTAQIPVPVTQQMIDLGNVFKADLIEETILAALSNQKANSNA